MQLPRAFRRAFPLLAFMLIQGAVFSQGEVYRSGGGEIILSGADFIVFSTLESGQDPLPIEIPTSLCLSVFFNIQQNLNIDFGKRTGVFTGLTIRNNGFKYNNPDQGQFAVWVADSWNNEEIVIKRSSNSLGIPLGVKVGIDAKRLYFYCGGEYEYLFRYKQKISSGNMQSVSSEWFSKRVNRFLPSLLFGLQLPYGVNLKFKYYLDDFLDENFSGEEFNKPVDYSQIASSRLWYISLSFNIDRELIEKFFTSTRFSKFNPYQNQY